MNKTRIFYFFLILILSVFLLSPIIVFDNTSNYESSFTINITRDFKNIGAKQSTFEFYFPENYFGPNSEFNIQPYSTNITFNPEPEEKYFEYDSFQNKILKFSYNNIYGFSVSLKFTGTLKSKNNNIVFIPFPYSEKEIKTADYIYLDSTSTSSILELAWQVSKNKSNLLSILFQIKQFIDTNIKYTPIYQNRTIDEIISDKIANREEILDLYSNILRAIGVPVRICCGIGLPQKFEFTSSIFNSQMQLYSGKGVITYLEIWTKDYGWVMFDPFFSSFISLNNFIKFGHAKYSNQLNYIFVKSQSSNITLIESYKVNYLKNDQIYLNKVDTSYLDYIAILPESYLEFVKIFKNENLNNLSLPYSGYNDIINKKIYFTGFDLENEIPLSNESIIQKFYLKEDFVFSDLFINSIIGNSKAYLRIYRGEEINDKFLIYQTEIDSSFNTNNNDKKINIKLPSIYLNAGQYLIHIFLAEPDKNCNLLVNNIPALPGLYEMNIIKNGKKIKTNLIFPLVFIYK